MEQSNLLVIGLGLGTVFFGLICLVVICMITSAICKCFEKETPKETAPIESGAIPNKQELIAASCAVIAEELGTEVKNIKVVSFKRV